MSVTSSLVPFGDLIGPTEGSAMLQLLLEFAYSAKFASFVSIIQTVSWEE